jgi:peptide/nickel transport system permease protein
VIAARPRQTALLVARRLGFMLVTLWFVATLTFLLTFAVPTDPARAIAGPKATAEQLDIIRRALGLDDPMAVQYLRYLAEVAVFDLGQSHSRRAAVSALVFERLPYTALLAFSAILFQLLAGGALGLAAAVRAGGWLDRAVFLGALVVVSLPQFWVGLLLLFVFGFELGWFPLGGAALPEGLVLPALTLGLPGAAWTARIVRATAAEALASNTVLGLRGRGIAPRRIVLKHVVRLAAGPVLSVLALDFGLLLGGAVLVESVFGWPGIGQMAFQALQQNDLPLLMGTVICGSVFVLVINALLDLARVALDPRTR